MDTGRYLGIAAHQYNINPQSALADMPFTFIQDDLLSADNFIERAPAAIETPGRLSLAVRGRDLSRPTSKTYRKFSPR